MNGKATANTSFYITDINYAEGTYAFALNNDTTVAASNYVQLETSEGNKTLAFSVANNKKVIECKDINALSIIVAADTNFNNFKFAPMLEVGNEYHDIEKYTGGQASPNPEYPSNIEAVGDNINLFDLASYYNKANLTRCTKQLLENGIRLSFEAGADAYIGDVLNQGATLTESFRQGCVKVEPNTTYTISLDSAPKCFVSYLDKNYTAVQKYSQIPADGIFTFITNSSTYYIYLRFGYLGTSDVSSYDFTNIKVERGKKVSSYSAFNKCSVKIDIINKNLVKINENNWDLTSNNTIKNKARNQGAILTQFNMKANIKYKINLKLLSKPTTASTFTGFLNNVAQNASKSFVNINNISLNTVKTIEFLSEEDVEFKMNFSGNANSEIFEFQLWAELNDTTEYEQHKSQTAIMPVQQELLENDYIADVEHHEWEKLTLDGNEEIIKDSRLSNDNRSVFFIKTNDIYSYTNASSIPDILSNQFKAVSQSSTWKSGDISMNSEYPNYVAMIMETGYTLESFKEWLSTNNPIVYYKLATPIDLELTEEQKAVREQKLYTYKNITNINLSDELASIDVEYKKDIETMNKNIENRLAELESALIS